MAQLSYTILLEPDPDEGGYTVTVPELPGVVTEGDTIQEAIAMAREAIELHLEGYAERGEAVPIEREPPILASVVVEAPTAMVSA